MSLGFCLENEDPLDLRRLSIFQKAAPLIAKRIEVNRAHFLLGYGKFVHDVGEESLGLFGPKSSGTTGFSGSFASHSDTSHRSKPTLHLRRSILSIKTKLNTRGDAKTHLRERHTLLTFYLTK